MVWWLGGLVVGLRTQTLKHSKTQTIGVLEALADLEALDVLGVLDALAVLVMLGGL